MQGCLTTEPGREARGTANRGVGPAGVPVYLEWGPPPPRDCGKGKRNAALSQELVQGFKLEKNSINRFAI